MTPKLRSVNPHSCALVKLEEARQALCAGIAALAKRVDKDDFIGAVDKWLASEGLPLLIADGEGKIGVGRCCLSHFRCRNEP